MAEVFKMMNETHPELQSFSDIHTWVGYYKFIIGIFNLYRLMHPIVPINQKLKGRAIDVIKTFYEVSSCIADLGYLLELTEVNSQPFTNKQKDWQLRL